MHKINIIYYEGFACRTLAIKMAKSRGENPFRPSCVHAEARYPIVPRPGDHIFFWVDKEDGKYYAGATTDDSGNRMQLSGVVQYIELVDGVDDLYAIVTDEGHKGRGEYDGDYDSDVMKMLDQFGS